VHLLELFLKAQVFTRSDIESPLNNTVDFPLSSQGWNVYGSAIQAKLAWR